MLTYTFDNKGNETLYEYLYQQIKNDIIVHKLKPHEKLPSKRAFAKHLSISTMTVENTYEQLVAEGYVYSLPKSGFYVSDLSMYYHKNIEEIGESMKPKSDNSDELPRYYMDFVTNSTAADNFPFHTWVKLLRETMSENKANLMMKSPSVGVYPLRAAIANHLYQFRGLVVDPEQIAVGAGTEYLTGLIIQLLGYDKTYAMEDPGYQMIHRIYEANKVKSVHIPLDAQGINIEALEQSHADILHISPSHHFPTGIVTPVGRRYELLSWASKSDDRYIIEDDYDSEFRLKGKPIPALQSIDMAKKVIYINTFSKSLTSTIRISYMILPKALMERYKKELSFYACTVSNFEQFTLAKYISQGYFERHINRMRNYYRNVRDAILINIRSQMDEKRLCILEENGGLHFLLQIDTELSDQELVAHAATKGIHVSCLSQYYYNPLHVIHHTLVINYSGVDVDHINEGVKRLLESFTMKG